MAKFIEVPDLTSQQKEWLKTLLSDASAEALGAASNNHIFAMGAKTQEEVIMFEKNADELRGYASALLSIATRI